MSAKLSKTEYQCYFRLNNTAKTVLLTVVDSSTGRTLGECSEVTGGTIRTISIYFPTLYVFSTFLPHFLPMRNFLLLMSLNIIPYGSIGFAMGLQGGERCTCVVVTFGKCCYTIVSRSLIQLFVEILQLGQIVLILKP